MMKETHEILREFPYGLYIVGVKAEKGDEANALVVSWLTQCSFDPPLLVMALREDSHSLALVRESRVFSVNVVNFDRKGLARRFVKPTDRVGNKLNSDATPGKETGAPILREALAALECRVKSIDQPGDHAVVIGEVVGAVRHSVGRQLVCADMPWVYGG